MEPGLKPHFLQNYINRFVCTANPIFKTCFYECMDVLFLDKIVIPGLLNQI